MPDDKKNQKVTSGKVSAPNGSSMAPKEKSTLSKFSEVFLPDDMANIRSYILSSVIIPTVKNALLDSLDALLFGRSGRRGGNSRSNSSVSSKISYDGYYRNDRRTADSISYKKPHDEFDYDRIGFESREDADIVLDTMRDAIERYDSVSIADLYDYCGIDITNWSLNKYGWTDLTKADVIRYAGEYRLRLPKATPLT